MELQVSEYIGCCENGSQNISHEWEELLYKLSLTDDPKLRDFAYQEMAKVRTTSQGVSFFDLGEKILQSAYVDPLVSGA